MNNFTITLTASPELLDVLKTIGQALTKNGAAAPAKKQPVSTTTVTPKGELEETAAEATTVTTEDITIEQVRAAVHSKSKAGKADKVKAVLQEYGVEKITALKKEQYQAFKEKIESLN